VKLAAPAVARESNKGPEPVLHGRHLIYHGL
jgi:hypothetical protein